MATEPKSNLTLASDPSKINPYDTPESQLSEYQQSLKDQIAALEQRYANPNYFKVAAGFFKPQLGGFAASLGSASEALGENVEQQRAAALPIAQMRAQLAQSNILMGQNAEVSKEIRQWHIDHPNEVPPPGMVSHWAGKAPDAPAVKALLGQQKLSMDQQQLLSTQQTTEMTRLMEMRKEGLISPSEYATRLRQIEARSFNIPTSPVSPSTPQGTTVAPEAQKEIAPPPPTPEPSAPVKTAENKPVANKPAEPDFSKFRITPSFSVSEINDRAVTEKEKADNARIIEGAKLLEAVREKQYQNLQIVNEPTAFATARDANESTLKMLDDEPNLAVSTTNMLRKAGPLVALLERGIGISVGPYGANINVAGARPALYASLSDTQQKYQDKLLNNIARSVYYDLKSRGIDPEKEGAEKFGQRMLQETHIEQGPAAIHRAIAQNDIRLKHNKALFETTNKYFPQAKKESLTPLHDLYTQHPEFKVLDIMLNKKLQATQ
jgi:hypothetical protein